MYVESIKYPIEQKLSECGRPSKNTAVFKRSYLQNVFISCVILAVDFHLHASSWYRKFLTFHGSFHSEILFPFQSFSFLKSRQHWSGGGGRTECIDAEMWHSWLRVSQLYFETQCSFYASHWASCGASFHAGVEIYQSDEEYPDKINCNFWIYLCSFFR